MAKAVRIIIVLASDVRKAACVALSETVYKKGEDWVIVESEEEAESHIVHGAPQLLILNGKLKATVFVMKMRRSNPALKAGCLSTSVGKNPEQYQYRVIQTDRGEFTGLVKAVAHYLTLVTPQTKRA